MASFVAKQKFPSWFPTNMFIFEVKLLKRKEAQVYSNIHRNMQQER